MQITDILTQMGGYKSIAQELGVSETQAASGGAALIPAILGGFKKQALSQPGGVEGLHGLLGQLGGGTLLDQVLAPQPTDVSQGNNVLGQIFGSPEVSRTVAQNAAEQSGLDVSMLKKMLPMLAMLVTGYMAKQQGGLPSDQGSGLGSLGGLIGNLFGGGGHAAPGNTGSGTPGIAAMLDMNGNGNVLDDILQVASKAIR